MAQSTFENNKPDGLHVALIMDGNGRWATARGLPRTAGHRAGVEAVRRVVEAAPPLGIGMLTLYAFSSDNWQRPPAEVRALMQLLRAHLPVEAERCRRHGVRLSVIGRRDRLPAGVCRAVAEAEACTAGGNALHVRIALDYSSRDALLQATRLLPPGRPVTREAFACAIARAYHAEGAAPDVDLLIRTGGERRLSDFLLWECAYAELYFTDCPWPDFDAAALQTAIEAFQQRERRFGRIQSSCAPHVTPVSLRVPHTSINGTKNDTPRNKLRGIGQQNRSSYSVSHLRLVSEASLGVCDHEKNQTDEGIYG